MRRNARPDLFMSNLLHLLVSRSPSQPTLSQDLRCVFSAVSNKHRTCEDHSALFVRYACRQCRLLLCCAGCIRSNEGDSLRRLLEWNVHLNFLLLAVLVLRFRLGGRIRLRCLVEPKWTASFASLLHLRLRLDNSVRLRRWHARARYPGWLTALFTGIAFNFLQVFHGNRNAPGARR